ncbi:MAG: helix-turn-helix transcriptional regulator [Bdellovibrionales bacterium]|nr:helix-turn-helix transcriptional regulator [Bdellovibrionales bacterium]
MHHFPYPTYLRTHRKRWGLSQRELASLLGQSVSLISRFERLSREPTVHALIGAEFAFGEPARRLFPGLYSTVEAAVTLRAIDFAERLAEQSSPIALVQRELLEEIARRAASDKPVI